MSRIISYFFWIVFILFLSVAAFFIRSGSDVLDKMYRQNSDSFSTRLPWYSKESLKQFYDISNSELYELFNRVGLNTSYFKIDNVYGLENLDFDEFLKNIKSSDVNKLTHDDVSVIIANLNNNPWVVSYHIYNRSLPNSLEITVNEAEPRYVAEYSESNWLISSKGVLLNTLDSLKDPELIIKAGSLPRIYNLDKTESEISYLRAPNQRLKYIIANLDFIELAGGFTFEYDSVFLLPMGTVMIEPIGGSPAKKIFFKVHSLDHAKTLLENFKKTIKDLENRGEKPEEIDLRYKDQIILR